MTRSERMARVTRLSQTAEQITAQAFRRARQELERQTAQRCELRAYQAEYLQRLQNAAATVGGYEAQQLRIFVQRIEAAVATLTERICQAERKCESERERWLAQRRKTGAYDEVTQRARREEAGVAERKLQREIDDRGPSRDRI